MRWCATKYRPTEWIVDTTMNTHRPFLPHHRRHVSRVWHAQVEHRCAAAAVTYTYLHCSTSLDVIEFCRASSYAANYWSTSLLDVTRSFHDWDRLMHGAHSRLSFELAFKQPTVMSCAPTGTVRLTAVVANSVYVGYIFKFSVQFQRIREYCG